MEWKCDKGERLDYYYISIDQNDNKEEALTEWWLKIFELAADVTDWDVVVADLWIDNTGRIIGHVQNKKDRVGNDKGFRVAITFNDWAKKLNAAQSEEEYDDILFEQTNTSNDLLSSTYNNNAVKSKVDEINKTNPFKAFWALRGRCDFEDGEFLID